MALKQYFIGSVGPLYYDDTAQAPGAPAGVYQAPFYVPDGAASNHVWTSDSFGRGFWQALSSGGLPAAHASTHYAGQSDPVDIGQLGGTLVVAQFNSGTGAGANTVWHGGMTWSAVALADMATIADGTILGNSSGIAAVPSALSTLPSAVQGNITALGTVTSGVWHGTSVGVVYGGTGLSSLAQGDLLYGSALNTVSALSKDTNAQRALTNGGVSNNPAWAQISLTQGVSGILPVANGGTNSSTQNWVDLSTTQSSIGGAKTFTALLTASLGLNVSGGNLQVGTGATTQEIYINGPAGANRQLRFMTAGVSRWLFRCNVTAESGSNAGSNFDIFAVSDGGSAIDNPTIRIVRAAGGAFTIARPIITTGGTVDVGSAGTTRGLVVVRRGSGTNTPGVVEFVSKGGTAYYLWAADDGSIRIHTSLPSADTDGNPITSSTGTFVLPAASIIPGTTGGCGTPTKKEAGTSLANYYTASFDKDSAQVGYWMFNLPTDYNGGTVTAAVTWECTGGAASKKVNFEISGVAYPDNTAITTAFGTSQDSIDTWQADDTFHISPTSSAITLGGTPAAGNLCCIKLRRDATDATNDDLAANALVSCIRLTYTRKVLA